jgi:hypothetical protein
LKPDVLKPYVLWVYPLIISGIPLFFVIMKKVPGEREELAQVNFAISMPMAGAGDDISKPAIPLAPCTVDVAAQRFFCDLSHAATKTRNMYVFPKFQLRNLAPKPYIPIYEKIIMLLT